ncbi:MAG TPA: hypothetical protein VFZ75_09410 [Actinomycetota bacterium]|nr:hypothetical protein [Actinomycetota bacterium]
MPKPVLELVAIAVPELVGETITGVLLRWTGGRWQRVALGDRRRAEAAVRFLWRQHMHAWVRPTRRSGYEVIVRTADAEVGRRLLNAPSSGRA